MSLGARITLAVACIVCAVGFVAVGSFLGPVSPAGVWPFYCLAIFCGLIALACLVRTSRPVALRIIGLVILVVCVIYAYESMNNDNYLRAVAGFVVFGLPSGYVAIWGRYPSWGKGSAAFRTHNDKGTRGTG